MSIFGPLSLSRSQSKPKSVVSSRAIPAATFSSCMFPPGVQRSILRRRTTAHGSESGMPEEEGELVIRCFFVWPRAP